MSRCAQEADFDRDRVGGTRPGVCPGVQPDRCLRTVAGPRLSADLCRAAAALLPETREIVVETVEPGFEVYSYPVVAPLWGWTRPDWRSERITIKTEEYTRITRDVRPPPEIGGSTRARS